MSKEFNKSSRLSVNQFPNSSELFELQEKHWIGKHPGLFSPLPKLMENAARSGKAELSAIYCIGHSADYDKFSEEVSHLGSFLQFHFSKTGMGFSFNYEKVQESNYSQSQLRKLLNKSDFFPKDLKRTSMRWKKAPNGKKVRVAAPVYAHCVSFTIYFNGNNLAR